jgi:hypothetical protein
MLVFPSPFPCSHGTMTILHTQSILSPWICPCITLCCPCWQQLMAMLLCSAMLPALLCLFAAVHCALLPALAVQYGYAVFIPQASCSSGSAAIILLMPCTSIQLAPMAIRQSHACVCVLATLRRCLDASTSSSLCAPCSAGCSFIALSGDATHVCRCAIRSAQCS